MPSTTKTIRREADFYETPEWCTRALMESLEIDIALSHKIVEPCAGNGAISKIIKEYVPNCTLVQYELNVNDNLQQYGDVTFGDFLKNVVKDLDVTHVITNPPFTYSQEFIDACRTNYPNAKIIMLLPFSFLGSTKRHEWWKRNTPTGIEVLSNRPSFTNDGKTDSTVYGWFVFNGTPQQMKFLKRGK